MAVKAATTMSPAGIMMLTLLLGIFAYLASAQAKVFELPALDYPYDGLEPTIDTQTMIFHHDTHHNGYVNNLNNLINSVPDNEAMQVLTLTHLVKQVGTGKLNLTTDQEITLRNNGGGAYNHAMFWRVMAPNGTNATDLPSNSSSLAIALEKDFGSPEAMMQNFSTAAATRFGSGWAWLVYDTATNMTSVMSTANQDNPLMSTVVGSETLVPLLCIDVWEHAYYLKNGPKRTTYIHNWWNVVNWRQVELNFEAAKSGRVAPMIGAAANVRV